MSKAFNEIDFEKTKENLFERLFVDMEQEFDGIQLDIKNMHALPKISNFSKKYKISP